MFVVKIVTDNSRYDVKDEIYTGYTEDYKSDQRKNVHLPVQKPDKSETEA